MLLSISARAQIYPVRDFATLEYLPDSSTENDSLIRIGPNTKGYFVFDLSDYSFANADKLTTFAFTFRLNYAFGSINDLLTHNLSVVYADWSIYGQTWNNSSSLLTEIPVGASWSLSGNILMVTINQLDASYIRQSIASGVGKIGFELNVQPSNVSKYDVSVVPSIEFAKASFDTPGSALYGVASTVPEPGTIAITALGVIALARLSWKKKA